MSKSTSSFTKEEVKRIAALAKLKFNQEEEEDIFRGMKDIITYFDALDEVDTKNIEPLVSPTEERHVMRLDKEIEYKDIKNKALELAPDSNSDYFKIKRSP